MLQVTTAVSYTHLDVYKRQVLVRGGQQRVVEKINAFVQADQEKGLRSGVMATDQTMGSYHASAVLSVGDRNDLKTVAARLFDVLRKFDQLEVDIVYAEVFDYEKEGLAVMNRLNKAAGFTYIDV